MNKQEPKVEPSEVPWTPQPPLPRSYQSKVLTIRGILSGASLVEAFKVMIDDAYNKYVVNLSEESN